MKKRSYMGMLRYCIYQLSKAWIFLPIYFLVNQIITYIVLRTNSEMGLEASMLAFVGIDALAVFVSAMIGLTKGFEFYNTAAACGISRKTSALTQITAYGITAFVMMGECMLLAWLYELINEGRSILLIDLAYGPVWNIAMWGTMPAFIFNIQIFIVGSFMIWAAALFGFMFCSLYSLFPRKVAVYLSIGLPVAVLAIWGGICANWEMHGIDTDQKLSEIGNAIMKILGMRANEIIGGNIFQGCVVFIIIGIIASVLGIIFSRRASVSAEPGITI
ncbi:MAG: hypothetical protein K2K57_10950 [Oscillospiraceae bacterium]|nr:hypothetical protein [Oscillospiraceae bacterium]